MEISLNCQALKYDTMQLQVRNQTNTDLQILPENFTWMFGFRSSQMSSEFTLSILSSLCFLHGCLPPLGTSSLYSVL